MALRVDYLAKETGNNLVRNPTLTIATVLTVAVSLTLLGTALLIRQGVDGINSRFRDDVQFIVWMTPDAQQDQIDATGDFLASSPTIRSYTYVNQEATFVEFQEYFAEQPEITDLVTPEQLPTSFKVVPEISDLALIRSVGAEIEALPGIQGVDYAEEYIKQLNDLTSKASLYVTCAALLAAVASSLLMYNTIRTGLFARRREIEVMRLVGATKWFIRVPFMLEGLLQGVIGAVASWIAIFGLNQLIARSVNSGSSFQLFSSFALDAGEVITIGVLLLLAGAALGALGSGIAVTRYLDA